MTGFSTLGFDPAPGDPASVRAIVGRLDRGIGSVDSALSLLQGGDTASWQGEAAEAFRTTMDSDFEPHLRDVGSAFRTSRGALAAWADELEDFQRRARDLEDQARSAHSQAIYYNSARETLAMHARSTTLTDDTGQVFVLTVCPDPARLPDIAIYPAIALDSTVLLEPGEDPGPYLVAGPPAEARA